jgi:DNA-binding CsgD family transcriptional regulator
VLSIPIQATPGRVPLIVHLLPVRKAAQDIFSGAATLMIVTPVDRAKVPGAEVLAGLFDLTAAEARVAREIAAGQTINEVAVACGISRETVRSQLKNVLSKTGLNRQADLAALLSGLTLPR